MPIHEDVLRSGVGQGDSTDHGSILIALSVVVEIRHTYARSYASSLSILFHPMLLLVGVFIRPWNLPTTPQQPQPNPTRASPFNIIPPIQRHRDLALTLSLTLISNEKIIVIVAIIMNRLSDVVPPPCGEIERFAGVDCYAEGVSCCWEGAEFGFGFGFGRGIGVSSFSAIGRRDVDVGRRGRVSGGRRGWREVRMCDGGPADGRTRPRWRGREFEC